MKGSRILLRLKLASAPVLGLSLGGRITMALALAEPAPDCISDPG